MPPRRATSPKKTAKAKASSPSRRRRSAIPRKAPAARRAVSARKAAPARASSPPKKVSGDSSAAIHAHTSSMTQTLRAKLRAAGKIVTNTVDNGGEPFSVTVAPSSGGKLDVQVHALHKNAGLLQHWTDVDEAWYGHGEYDLFSAYSPGCAMLLRRGRTVVAVSTQIGSWTLAAGERITDLVATVQNSAVVYGYVETTRGVYAVPGFNCVNKLYLVPSKDVPAAKKDGVSLQCVNAKALPTFGPAPKGLQAVPFKVLAKRQ